MVGMVLAIWIFSNTLIEWLRPMFVEFHLTLPIIGNQHCQVIPVGQEAPQGTRFGMPGFNNLGCFVDQAKWWGVTAAVGMFILSIFTAWFAGMREKVMSHGRGGGGSILGRMMDKGVESILLLVLITMWPTIIDFASASITDASISIAASPWGDSHGDYNLKEQNAGKTISFVYDATRDPGLGSTDCTKMVDSDNDGFYDKIDYSWWCLAGKAMAMSPADWVMAFLLFLFTSFVSITMTLSANTLMVLRLLMTGALIGLGPLFIVMSRLPLINKIGKIVVQTLVGLMLAPLLVAGIAVAGHDMINSEVIHLHEKGVPEASIKFGTYIMAIGVIGAMMTGVVMVAGPLAPMMIALPGVISGAVTQVMANSARAGGTLGASAIGTMDADMGRIMQHSGNVGVQLAGYGGGIGNIPFGGSGGSDASNYEIEHELANSGEGAGYGGDRYEDTDYGQDAGGSGGGDDVDADAGDSGDSSGGGGKYGGGNAAV